MTLPILPGLGATDATESTTPKLDFRKALLPALGAVALGGQGGGAFLRAFLQGQMAKLEREERDVEKRVAAQEKKDALRRDFLLKASSALGGIDDPELFEETKAQLRQIAEILQLDATTLDVYAFPESKRKRVKQQRAASVFEQLIKTGRFFEDATYEVDGEKLSGRELMILAGVPRGTRKVTEPVTEEIDVPRVEEGGLARFLAPAGRQAVQVGTRERDEEIPFTTPRRLTLGEAYPEVFAKSGREHLARLPVPLDKDGFPDTVKIAELMAKAGVQNPLEAAKRGQERVEKDRTDFDRRLARIQQAMDQADTPEGFRVQVIAYNRLIDDFKEHKPWVGVKQVSMSVAQAIAEWVKENVRRKAGAGGDGAVGPPLGGGVLDVRPIRNKKGIITHYSINGEQFTVQQATDQAKILFFAGDPHGRALATVLQISPKVIAQWNVEAKGGKQLTDTRRQLRLLEEEMEISGIATQAGTDLKARRDAATRLRTLTIRRTQLLRRFPGLRGTSQAVPVPPATPGGQVVPEGAPTATNPQTGQRVYWDGSTWVPIP